MGNGLEATCGVEASGKLIGDRLIVDKAVGAGRADGAFVKVHGVERAAFNTGDFRADQRRAVLEILGAILRPDFELSVVGSQPLQMPLPLAGRFDVPRYGAGQRAIKVILRRF